MVRGGEMMLIIRAQDYASRTLHKVSGEVAGMQRMQRIQARAQKQYLPALRQEAQLYKNLAYAENAWRTGVAKSNAVRASNTRANRVLTREFKAAEKAWKDFGRSMQVPAGLNNIRNNINAIEQLGLSIRRLDAERLHRVGSAMSGIGRTMQLFGAVGTLALGLTANAFAKFSQSAATAGTQMRDLGGSVAQAVARSKQLQEAILDMSMVFPNSAQEMTDAAYEIFSSMNLMHNGVMNVNAGLKLLAVSNKAAVAGGVDLKEATNAMIVALNIFDPKLKDVQGTMDEVFNIVRFGKIRLDDLSHVFTQFASAAHAGGMSLKEVGAAFATLTLFNDPGKASAGLGRLIELLRTPAFTQGLQKSIGVDVIAPDTGKMKPLLQIMQEIVKARPDLAASRKAAIDFFIQLTKASGITKAGIQGTVQARRAFETFATHMGTFADTVKNVSSNYDEMNKAFQARMADPGVQWELFKNRLKALALIIGQQVLPVFLKIGEWIAGAVRWFKGLNDGTSGTILRFAAWASVALLLSGVLLSMGGSIVQLIATMALLRIAAVETGAAFITMRTAIMASGLGLIAVGAGVAAVAVMTHWDQVRAYFHAWWDDIGAGFSHLWADQVSKAKGAAGLIISFFGKIREKVGLGSQTSEFGQRLYDEANAELANRSDTFLDNYNKWLGIYKKQRGKNAGMNWLKDFKRITGEFDGRMLSEEYKKWANSVSDSTGKAAQLAKDHAQAVKQATDNMQATIKTATTNLVNMYEQMQSQNEAALGGLFQGPTMSGILGNVFKNINDNLRQFGVQIRVPFSILRQDLEQSVTYFKRWRNDIAQLTKRGVPYEMVSQLQAMGTEGIPIIEGLLAAPKGQFRAIVKTYKQGQALTDKATKEDMARKLKYWESFGQDAAWKTIMGIVNNPKNAKIATMYENYVKNTYGSILKKTFQDDVATYMANAIQMAKQQAAQANLGAAMPNLFKPTAKATLATMTPQQLTNLYKQNARKIETMRYSLLNQVLGGKSVTKAQEAAFNNLLKRRQAILAEYRRDAAPSVRRQMRRQAGHEVYTITYEGDTIHIKADGATVASVTRALQKKHFKQKNRHKKGTTATRGGGHP